MEIDDLLEKEGFKEASERLYSLMEETAGPQLVKTIENCFGDRKLARDWFYSQMYSYPGKRPYDLCLDGKGEKVERVINRIAQGIFQ